jgi:hypothetical protein
MDRRVVASSSREKELTRRASELERKSRSLSLREKKLREREKELFRVEERLRREGERISATEEKILAREKKVYAREKALEAKERELASSEKKKRAELLRILDAERKGKGELALLRRREFKKRSELAKVLSREYGLREKEGELLKDERRLESLDEALRRKEQEKTQKLEELAGTEKKLEELELHLEKDRGEIARDLTELRRMKDSLHLKKLGERARTSGWKKKPPALKPGNIYLIDEHDILVSGVIPSKSIELLEARVESGSPGLYVTRSNPKQVQGEVGLRGVDVVWMTDSSASSGGYKTVYSIEHLSIELTKFIKSKPKASVLLDGLEYLISNTGFDVVLPFIQSMRDFVSTTEAVVIIPINSGAFDPHELSLLSRECYKLG